MTNIENDVEIIVIDDKIDEDEHYYQVTETVNNFIYNYCTTKGSYPPLSSLEPLAKQMNLIWNSRKFYEQLKKCNFIKRILNGCGYVVENPIIPFQRYQYLNVLKVRKKQVYYLEARLVDDSLTFNRCWDKIDTSTENKLVFMSACSMAGFVTGVYFNTFEEDILVHWLSNVLLTFVKESSIFVFDHAPCLSKPINMAPSKFDSSESMCKWLEMNNVPYNSNMRKYELVTLIEKFKHKTSVEYKIDRVLKAHGHEVLHLPKHMRNMTPYTVLWDKVKSDLTKIEEKNKQMPILADTVSNIISSKTKEFWTSILDQLRSKEKRAYVMDLEIERHWDKVVNASHK